MSGRSTEGETRPESNMTGVKVFQLGHISQSDVCSGHYGWLPVILCTCRSVCVVVCVCSCCSSEECQESLSLKVHTAASGSSINGSHLPFPASLPPSFLLSLQSLNGWRGHNKAIGQTICYYMRRE